MAAIELAPWIDATGEGGLRNSMVEYPGNGVKTAFDFNFSGGYLNQSDVKAYIYDTVSGSTAAITTVFAGPNTLSIVPAPSATKIVVIYRDTQKTVPLVDFKTGAVIDEINLDTATKQSIFVAAEMADRFDAINASSADAIERSFTALTTANTALANSAAATVTADGAEDAAAAAVSTANAANANAAAAVITANGIDGKAQAALDASAAAVITADAAEDAATAATSTANGIDAKAQSALDTANAAATQVAGAVSTANAASAAVGGKMDKSANLADVADKPAARTNLTVYSIAEVDSIIPAGMVMASAFTGDVAGWVICDGRAIPRTGVGARLFAALSTFYGVGDGSTTFNVPNYTGLFLRMTGGNAAGLGVLQASDNLAHIHGVTDPKHTHVVNDPPHDHGLGFNASGPVAGGGGFQGAQNAAVTARTAASTTGVTLQTAATGISINSSGGAESRPVNKAVVYRIKL